MKIIEKGKPAEMSIELPQGFVAAGLSVGIKQAEGALDLALLVSQSDCSAAGVYTQNQVVGAPVIVSRSRTPATAVRSVIINSGNSNACTGDRGLQDARRMTALVAELLGTSPEAVLVCSTGVIGRFLPMEKIEAGIRRAVPALSSSAEAFLAAAQGMMTTDTFSKQAVRELNVGGTTVRISGLCKGAAMIAPNMATMLGVVLTDARLAPQSAQQLLQAAVDQSFNCISVDGHTSTSDTVLLLANGASGQTLAENHADWPAFRSALEDLCRELSQMIIRDAEGATHFVEVRVTGAASADDARKLARSIAESLLVKTAITGNDPNWGRIVSAAGYAGVPFEQHQASLKVNQFLLYERGSPTKFDEAEVSRSMSMGEILIEFHLTQGEGAATFWTSDLTAEYVRLNADYTT